MELMSGNTTLTLVHRFVLKMDHEQNVVHNS